MGVEECLDVWAYGQKNENCRLSDQKTVIGEEISFNGSYADRVEVVDGWY